MKKKSKNSPLGFKVRVKNPKAKIKDGDTIVLYADGKAVYKPAKKGQP